VEIQVLSAIAWVSDGQGNREEALKYMRGAADLEDSSEKHVSMENRLYPMREQLGDMLRAHGKPAEALKEYQLSLKNAPNRLRGYYGAAKAAEDSGQAKKASGYYKELARLTRDADGDRPEIVELKQYLASAR
jgi:tetratricopeptide (TPR) repeat protein